MVHLAAWIDRQHQGLLHSCPCTLVHRREITLSPSPQSASYTFPLTPPFTLYLRFFVFLLIRLCPSLLCHDSVDSTLIPHASQLPSLDCLFPRWLNGILDLELLLCLMLEYFSFNLVSRSLIYS